MDNLNIQNINGFKVQKVAPNVWAIDDFAIDIVYLVIGSEKAAVIDTGMGYGNLRGVIETLTDKPYFIINTHGHLDHIGGNEQFTDKEIFVNKKDWILLENQYIQKALKSGFNKCFLSEGFYGNEYYDSSRTYYGFTPKDITGDVKISLGDKTLQILEVPGHTVGSIAVLDVEDAFLFSGDAVVSTPILIYDGLNSASVSTFSKSMKYLLSFKDDIELIFPGHYLRPIGFTYIKNLYDLSQKIIYGSVQKEKIDMSHMTKENTIISRYERASIIYTENSI